MILVNSRPIEGVNSNLRSPMLNSLREWGERRSTRVFALKIAQKHLEFEGVCTVTDLAVQACLKREAFYTRSSSDSVVFPSRLNILFHGPFEFIQRIEFHLGTAVGQKLNGGCLTVYIPLKIVEESLYGDPLFVGHSRFDSYICHAA